ncbi:MAG: aminopeptidase [Acholeplasmatales bacterium]|nr:aminopeptidase [Acholeplasmatales bacterium]
MYKKNAWNKYNENELKSLFDFCDDYKDFISECKTERECVTYTINLIEKLGYKNITSFKDIKPGDKLYAINKNKNIAIFNIGKKPIVDGINILGAHIDSPRIDIKQNPLYESDGFALLDGHYYGGIIKYQWVTIRLAIHGVVCKKDGSTVNVVIGENPNDPVFVITDLLPHLGSEKLNKTGAKVVEGEDLDITVGSIGLKDIEKESVKNNILKILNEKYNISDEDFISAEFEIVPEGKARDLGFDKSMILGYGHDDRVCAYTSLRAIIDSSDCCKTVCAYLVDKEEIGSVGATGAHSLWFQNTLAELINLQNKNYNDLLLRRTLSNSFMLSSDVSAGYDPLYKSVFEKNNACFLGSGLTFNKYTGARGKSGCNDAMPEFMAKIRKIMDDNKVNYQTAELGKVDAGGGGTIAYIMGNQNMNVIDAGVPVLSMHAPQEVVSKADVYEAYLGYMAFIKEA